MPELSLAAIARDTISYPLSSLRDERSVVQSIQSALRRLGFLLGNADGIWRADTASAYTAFCYRFGLLADELSPRAAGLLLKAIPSSPPLPPPSRSLFEEALRFTLRWEGGYVNHPADHGGETNKGITTATYRDYRARKGLPRQSVRFITDAEVREIYENMYWKPARCEAMARPLAIAHFDTAVNFGVGGATLFLQELLRVPVDRVFGPRTQTALGQCNHADLGLRYPQLRIDYRYRRVNRDPSQRVFLQGWLNRDNDLMRYIQQLS
ncbi:MULTISPECIES: glycosyl hydrolase 108 family protein [unclassified Leptolyngbya]|uniref:glycosyl hydrolase 108 family protein n=1 Tax=unclassified Leptolyngbya TaxID=2650499 RepID=UPI0016840B1A|nr:MULTISPECIES: glycosyl hydrolase 108 family protein [unclassified Leptolyngbya]MBD1913829.1 secretion activating protein [Leptolyngbya sp. FACHB-8]MBD2156532.1 secretion activating protein [Leptolyngbya sp. FACHB-16]